MTDRCAGQLIDENDVITGCPEEAIELCRATGTLRFDGAVVLVALCESHRGIMDNRTMTVTLAAAQP